MKFTAAIIGSFEKGMRAEIGRMERAIPEGLRAAGGGLQGALRGQVTAAGLGSRLARTWRSRTFPNRGHDAAALVWTRAPQIIRGHAEGATIRARGGGTLAIPTPAAPKRGPGGKRITPELVAKMFGRPLRFVHRRGRHPILVMDGLVARGGKRGGFRAATVRKASARRGAHVSLSNVSAVVMFVLIRQVRLRKRLDVSRAARRWVAQTPQLIRQAIAGQR